MIAVSITLLYNPSLQTLESFPLKLTSTLLSCFSESSPAGIDQNDTGATVLTVSVATIGPWSPITVAVAAISRAAPHSRSLLWSLYPPLLFSPNILPYP